MKLNLQAAQALLKQKQAELESLEEQLESQELLEQMPIGILIFDHKEKLTFANSMVRNELMEGQDFTISKFIETLKSKGPHGKHLKTNDLAKVLKKGKQVHYESITFEDRYLEVTAMPLINFQDEVYGGAILIHDVSTFKNTEEIKNEFISLASHQLRNPANQISWYAEMLADAGKLNAEQAKYLKLIEEGSIRMNKLVKNLLNLSRLESGRLKIEPKSTDLEVLVEEAISDFEEMKNELGCNITLSRTGKRKAIVNVDESLLSEVIKNLISNAISYSNKDSCNIEVILKKEPSDGYIISVTDEGIGIPSKDQDSIFEKFFRAENATAKSSNGTGLGLYLVKMIIDASGGKIWFESKEGEGTTFYVKIPSSGMKAKKGDKGLN